jgi:predicted RNA binding protein YcfA (HicA-like mRNA interferase family)
MPTWRPLSRRELIVALKAAGFSDLQAGGKHEYVERNGLRVYVPNPHKGDIGVGFLSRILKQAGITKEEWESL